MARSHSIRSGTCGWSYPDWVGPFYPEGTPASDFLGTYSQHFDIVEVDSTFYRPPTAEMIDHWRTITSRSFQFSLKVPQLITHEKCLLGCRDDYRAFVETVRNLGKKLHSVLLQFPYFNKQAFNSSKEFFERLERFLAAASEDEVPIAIEIRNKTWLTDAWFEMLAKHGAAFTLIDHPWMPSIPEMIERYDCRTGPFSYVRLLGDREGIEKITKSWGKTVVDRAERLHEIAEAVSGLAAKTDVVVFANNHYAGHAPSTVTDFISLMGRPAPIP